MMNNTEFGKRLQELRKENNLSQSELSERIGCSVSAISKYELGKRTPDITFLDTVADFFNVPVDYLLGRSRTKVIEPDLTYVCNYLCLSEKAIQQIEEFTAFFPIGCQSGADIFNYLCETGDLISMCTSICSYLELTEMTQCYKEIIRLNEKRGEDTNAEKELYNFAKDDTDYFKWQIEKILNEMIERVIDHYLKKFTNSKLSLEEVQQKITWYGSIQSILEHHKKNQEFVKGGFDNG